MLFFMRILGCPTIFLKSRGLVSYVSKLYKSQEGSESHPKYLTIEK